MTDIPRIEIGRVIILGAGFSRAFAMTTSRDIVRDVIQYLEVQPRFSTRYQLLVNQVRAHLDLRHPDWRQKPPDLLQMVSPYFRDSIDASSADPLEYYRKGIAWETDNCVEEAVTLFPRMCDSVGTPLPPKACFDAYTRYLLPFELLLSTYLFVNMLRENIRKPEYKWAYDLFSTIHEHDVILTFNWDLLAETLLSDIGKPFTLDNWSADQVKLLKLHGSIDLFGQPNAAMEREAGRWTVDKLSAQLWRYRLWQVVFRRTIYPADDFVWANFNKSPVLIMPPYYGLGYLYQHIQLNWQRAKVALMGAKEIYIIGYSLSDHDMPFQALVTEARPRAPVCIWNPDLSVTKRAEEVFGKNAFQFIKESASAFHFN